MDKNSTTKTETKIMIKRNLKTKKTNKNDKSTHKIKIKTVKGIKCIVLYSRLMTTCVIVK